MAETFRFAVLLSRPEGAPLERLTAALAAHGNVPSTDAARQARRAWGMPAEGLDREQAHALSRRLADEGIDSVPLPDNLIEELPAPSSFTRAAFEQRSFIGIGRNGGEENVPYQRIGLLAAAGYRDAVPAPVGSGKPALAQSLEMLGLWPGPGAGRGPAARSSVSPPAAELRLRLEVYLRKPLRRFRIDADAFDYSCLKGLMAYNVLANFRTLVCELSKRSSGALQSRGCSLLTGGGPVTAMGYEGVDELERESRWLLTLATLRDP